MDDPRDLTLADMAALRDLDEEGDGDVFDALVGVEIAPNRRAAVEKLAADQGGKIVVSYLTMGAYDRITVLDMPDGEAMARFALGLGALGNLRTTTLRGFPDQEGQELIASLP